MAIIATNTSRLPLDAKIAVGQQIITMSTANPNVPGNTAALTAFTEAQTDLIAALEAVTTNRQDGRELMSARDAAMTTWGAALTCLAGFTENATQGDRTKILSAGFAVRGEPTPAQIPVAPENVRALTNGSPGVTKLDWDSMEAVAFYIIQYSPDPITPTSWVQIATSTKSAAEVNGAEPGRECWFRVAAVNAAGQGPWSPPACREVM